MSTAILEEPPRAVASFDWPEGFERVPDQAWTSAPVDEFGLNYDDVGTHGWYKNLEPTVAMVLSSLAQGEVLVDFSAGTGILAKRLLNKFGGSVGILNVDASSKFLRVALENLRDDERAAFRLIGYLRDEKRLQTIDEVVEQPMLDHGANILTATNAIHLYYDLPDTIRSWTKILRPGGQVFICSGNMNNPNCPPGQWIIDNTVEHVNEIVADLVLREPAFEQYRDNLTDATKLAAHTKLREKVFVPVRDLDYYEQTFEDNGFDVVHSFDATINARVDEWYDLLATYHDGVMSWVGGSPKVDGVAPSADDVRNRKFLIRYGLEKLFPGQESFPCTWTYLTCRLR
ncbi:MAG: class I SAM-dependent methyltransferase [Euzebya sp.]